MKRLQKERYNCSCSWGCIWTWWSRCSVCHRSRVVNKTGPVALPASAGTEWWEGAWGKSVCAGFRRRHEGLRVPAQGCTRRTEHDSHSSDRKKAGYAASGRLALDLQRAGIAEQSGERGVSGGIQPGHLRQTTSNTVSAAQNSHRGLFKGSLKASCAWQRETAWEADTKGPRPLAGVSSRDLRGSPSESRATSSLELVGCGKGSHGQNPLRLTPSPSLGLGLEPSSGSKLSSPRAPVLVLPLRGHCPSLSWVPVLKTIDVYLLVVLVRREHWSLLFHWE